MEQKASFWKPALIYSAIMGFVSILFSVIFYIMGLSMANWNQWVTALISLAVFIYCLLAYRKEYLGGYATFKQIFLMALVIGIIATILSTINSYILMGIVDTELVDKMKLVQEEKIMNNPRIPESTYDMVLERMERMFTLKRMLVIGFLSGIFMNTIIGLIAAAFIKKEETPAEL
jgi:hypothetical protein